MSLTKPPATVTYLSAVRLAEKGAVAAETADRLAAAAARMTDCDPIPAAVLDQLDGLDADHQTACDVLDLAAADVDQARKELSVLPGDAAAPGALSGDPAGSDVAPGQRQRPNPALGTGRG